jgi:hypothetical protein
MGLFAGDHSKLGTDDVVKTTAQFKATKTVKAQGPSKTFSKILNDNDSVITQPEGQL